MRLGTLVLIGFVVSTGCTKTEVIPPENLQTQCLKLESVMNLGRCQRYLTGSCSNAELEAVRIGLGDPAQCSFYEDEEALAYEGTASKCIPLSESCLQAIATWKTSNASNADAEVASECLETAGTGAYSNGKCQPLLEDYAHCTSLGCTCKEPFGGPLCDTLVVDDPKVFPAKENDGWFFNPKFAIPDNSKMSRWRLYVRYQQELTNNPTQPPVDYKDPAKTIPGENGIIKRTVKISDTGIKGVKKIILPNMVFTTAAASEGLPKLTRAQGPGYFDYKRNGDVTQRAGQTYQYALGEAFFKIEAVFVDNENTEDRVLLLETCSRQDKSFQGTFSCTSDVLTTSTSQGRISSGVLASTQTRQKDGKTVIVKDVTNYQEKRLVRIEYTALQMDIKPEGASSAPANSFDPTSLESSVFFEPNCDEETDAALKISCQKSPEEYVLKTTTNQIKIVVDTRAEVSRYCTSTDAGTFEGFQCPGVAQACFPGEVCCGDGKIQKPLETCDSEEGCSDETCTFERCAMKSLVGLDGKASSLNTENTYVELNNSVTLEDSICSDAKVVVSDPVMQCTKHGWSNNGLVSCAPLWLLKQESMPESITEKEGSYVWSVSLGAKPTHDVVVRVNTSSAQDVSAPSSIAFTPDNYAVPQTVRIKGVTDMLLEGTETLQVALAFESADTRFNGRLLQLNNVVLQDSTQAEAFYEGGDSGSYVLAEGDYGPWCFSLSAQPSQEVLVSASSDTNDISFFPAVLRFTQNTWNAIQCFKTTAVSDNQTEPEETHPVILGFVSQDPLWNKQGVLGGQVRTADVVTVPSLSNIPSSRIAFSVNGGYMTDESGTETTVAIQIPPQASDVPDNGFVTLEFIPSKPYEVRVSALRARVAKGETQQVRIKGVDDTFADGDISYALYARVVPEESSAVFASDGAFLIGQFTNKDNDNNPVVRVSPETGSVSEPSGVLELRFTLSAQPLQEVRINMSLPQQQKLQLLNTYVTLSSENWNSGAVLQVQALDNTYADGPHTLKLTTSNTVSSETAFNNKNVPDVSVLQQDNDTAVCGNNIVEQGERCDDGGTQVFCGSDCVSFAPSICGDGVRSPSSEVCDWGNLNRGLPGIDGMWCNKESTPACDVLPYRGFSSGGYAYMESSALDSQGRSTGTLPVFGRVCENNAVATGIQSSGSLYPRIVCSTLNNNNTLGASVALAPFDHSPWSTSYATAYASPSSFNCPVGMVLVGQSLLPASVLASTGPGGRCRPLLDVLLSRNADHHDGNTVGLNEPAGSVRDYCPPGFVVHGFYARTSYTTLGFGMRCKRLLPYPDRSELPLDNGVRVVVTPVSFSSTVYESGGTYSFKLGVTGTVSDSVKVKVLPSGILNVGTGAGVAREYVWTSANPSQEHTVTVSAANNSTPEGDRVVYVYVDGLDNTYPGDNADPIELTLSDSNLPPSGLQYGYANPVSLTKGVTSIFAALSYSGGRATSFSLTGALPTGISFSPNTGSLNGVPYVAGVFDVTVNAANAAGTGSVALRFEVKGVCGDNLLEYPEACDGSSGCTAQCTLAPAPRCGDGVLDTTKEVCDAGTLNRPSKTASFNDNNPTNDGAPFCLDTCDNLPLVGVGQGGFRFVDYPLLADNQPNTALSMIPRECKSNEVATGVSYSGKCYYTLLCSSKTSVQTAQPFSQVPYNRLDSMQHGTRPWCPDAGFADPARGRVFLPCPAGSVVVGQVLSKKVVSSGGVWYDIGPAARCATLADVASGMDFRNGLNASRLTAFLNQTNAINPTYQYITHFCPPGFVVTGFYTRTGWATNAFGMRCSPLSSRQ